MAWHEPFDLYYWFVNVFAGSMSIFLAIIFIVIAAMAGMFRMPTLIVGIMFALFIIMEATVMGNLFTLVLFVIGLVIAWALARLIK